MESFVFEQKALYRADFLSLTSDYRVQCPRVGLGSNSRTSSGVLLGPDSREN